MRTLLAVAVALAVLGGCSEGDPGADGDVESLGDLVPSPVAEDLTRSGACDDGVLWAADDTGSLAVTAEVATAGTETAELPSEDVVVTVVHGEDLDEAVCEPSSGAVATRSPATQGRIEVDGCAFRVDGLEAEDGTTFAPIETSC